MAKPSIHLLGEHMKKWIKLKIRIRRYMLPDRLSPADNELLLSNPFEDKVFPDKAIKDMIANTEDKNILPALGLTPKPYQADKTPEPPRKKQKYNHSNYPTQPQLYEIPTFQKKNDNVIQKLK